MSLSRILTGVALCAILAEPAMAAVTAEEAKLLGTKLTQFGAEKAGNSDGTIPPYTVEGAKIKMVPGADPEQGIWPNPFASDKTVLTITGANADQYKSKLDEGTLALLKRWPDSYRLNVYPTRRTAPYPDWVLKNTVANATKAKLVNDRGDGVTGAHAGIPFPIPKNGLEVLWNNYLSWIPLATEGRAPGFMVDSSGSINPLDVSDTYYEFSYYNPDSASLDGPYFKQLIDAVAPPSVAGKKTLKHYTIDFSKDGDTAWAYTPGQRRVRVAPEFSYDTPASPYGGVIFYDEVYGYAGRPDRFDWKLVGKKEMYVPYNSYDFINSDPKDLLNKNHPNADKMRWELHRVWEVVATLRPDSKHFYKERRFYFDEDSWKILLTVGYDQAGQIHRVGQEQCAQQYDPKSPYFACGFTFQDLTKGQYMATRVTGGSAKGFQRVTALRPSSATNAAAMAGAGIR